MIDGMQPRVGDRHPRRHQVRCAGLALLVAGLLGLPGRLSAQGASPALAFRGVTVIDVADGRRLPDQTVVVAGNRIQAVGPARKVAIPSGARVIDARGRYLIPGLWDMHVHLEQLADSLYPALIGYGITGLREMGQRFPHGADSFRVWQREILAGTRVGPRVVGPSFDESYDEAIDRQYGSPMRKSSVAAVRMIDSLKAVGTAFVKVHTASMISRDIYFTIAREARRVGLPFVGHIPDSVSEIEASESGQRSIEHIQELDNTCWPEMPAPPDTFLARRCTPVAQAFVRNDTWVVPTLYVSNQSGHLENAQEVTRLMHRLGVPMLAGSDIMRFTMETGQEVPGLPLHDELRFLVGAGLTPLEALQTATLNPARFFHATDSLGTIAPGQLADLVVLDADPLLDIRNTETIRAVIANGRYFDSTALATLRAVAPIKIPRERVEDPTVYFGYRRAGRSASAEALHRDTLTTYTAPAAATLPRNAWGLSGAWRVSSERATLPVAPGRLVLRFRARHLSLMVGPGSLPEPLRRPSPVTKFRVRVRLDGEPPREERGADITPDGEGQAEWLHSLVLVHQQGPLRERTIEIEFLDPVVIYQVSFEQRFEDR